MEAHRGCLKPHGSQHSLIYQGRSLRSMSASMVRALQIASNIIEKAAIIGRCGQEVLAFQVTLLSPWRAAQSPSLARVPPCAALIASFSVCRHRIFLVGQSSSRIAISQLSQWHHADFCSGTVLAEFAWPHPASCDKNYQQSCGPSHLTPAFKQLRSFLGQVNGSYIRNLGSFPEPSVWRFDINWARARTDDWGALYGASYRDYRSGSKPSYMLSC